MQNLLNEALAHRAVRHPYLNALSQGAFPDMPAALRDFAVQYAAYNSWFPNYLTAAISQLHDTEHRRHLLCNLTEEQGQLSEAELQQTRAIGIADEWIQGVPHTELFRQFATAIGADPGQMPDIAAEIWRESLLALIQNGTPLQALGAIGLATESIVREIYRPVVKAISTNTDLSPRQYVFFTLHTVVDDEHGIVLLQIAEQIAAAMPDGVHELRKGMLKALNLRAAFWDALLVRAEQL